MGSYAVIIERGRLFGILHQFMRQDVSIDHAINVIMIVSIFLFSCFFYVLIVFFFVGAPCSFFLVVFGRGGKD